VGDERHQAATAEPRAIAEPGPTGWYLYGVAGSTAGSAGAPSPAIDGRHPVTTITEDGLTAVASRVPLAEFGETELREHLSDMGWVERVARIHEEVLEQLLEHTTVIPMRMCTVYRDEAGVRAMLDREAELLEAALAHLAGRREWGVKGFLMAPRHAESAAAGAATGGADYLRQRRAERDRRDHAAARADAACAAIHNRLRALAVEGLLTPPQRPEASGHAGQMLLNGVYLVADDARGAFHRELDTLREELADGGLELVLTGPWPAYNFVPTELGAAV
jgi:hypothetical protein